MRNDPVSPPFLPLHYLQSLLLTLTQYFPPQPPYSALLLLCLSFSHTTRLNFLYPVTVCSFSFPFCYLLPLFIIFLFSALSIVNTSIPLSSIPRPPSLFCLPLSLFLNFHPFPFPLILVPPAPYFNYLYSSNKDPGLD